jgi:hypothetical protein
MTDTQTKKLSPAEVYQAAQKAAQAAYEDEKSRLRAMVVRDESTGEQWYCSGGPCGFAWVTIKPARGAFVAWLKKQPGKYGRGGIGSSAYGGGWQLWGNDCVSESRDAEFGQSMQLKEAACGAFAEVLRQNGLNAHAGSRMD